MKIGEVVKSNSNARKYHQFRIAEGLVEKECTMPVDTAFLVRKDAVAQGGKRGYVCGTAYILRKGRRD